MLSAEGRETSAQFRVIGVLGGMGQMATIDFLHKIVAETGAATDQEHVPVPMIHLVDAAPQEVQQSTDAGASIGLLATDATIASGLYENHCPLNAGGGRLGGGRLKWMLPTAREMTVLVMPGISAVKAGDNVLGASLLVAAASALARRGASAAVLGCTEIPLVLHDDSAPLPVIDATRALARRSVAWSRDCLRK
ncbi:MAG: aspartate/glutamate racemase family protein [Variovorax sp.]